MLRVKGILRRGQAWQPQAWRVFVQTESAANVPSALAPVELALRFRNASPSEGKKDLFEERRPELLEWIANPLLRNFLAPEDDAAEAGLADVPMPFPMDGTPAQLFQRR